MHHASPWHVRDACDGGLQATKEGDAAGETGLYALVDDGEMHRRVVDKLKSVEGHTIAQQDLKEALNYGPGRSRHREWANVRNRLVKMGVIEEVPGRLNNVPIQCIK